MDTLDDSQRIGVGDRLSFRVIEDKEDSKLLVVADSGELEIPYLGRMKVAEKTCKQLASEVKSALEKDLYYRATVMVSAEAINKTRATGKVYVSGAVRNPGGFDVPAGDTLTVSRAILNAGGFIDFSDKRNVLLTRRTEHGIETHPINVQDILSKGKLDEDVVVQPGDQITVKERLVKW
jgi:polysaccharide export outer membrane protein